MFVCDLGYATGMCEFAHNKPVWETGLLCMNKCGVGEITWMRHEEIPAAMDTNAFSRLSPGTWELNVGGCMRVSHASAWHKSLGGRVLLGRHGAAIGAAQLMMGCVIALSAFWIGGGAFRSPAAPLSLASQPYIRLYPAIAPAPTRVRMKGDGLMMPPAMQRG